MPPEPRIEDLGGPATEPPGSTKKSAPESPPRLQRTKRLQALEVKLQQLYLQPAQLGMMAAQSRRDERLQTAINSYATLVPSTVDAWIELAETNPRVLVALENVVSGSVIGTLIVNHVLMVVPFLPPHIIQRFNPLDGGQNGNQHRSAPAT